MNYKNAVLKIWYSKDGKAYPFEQGKIYLDQGKWVYLADMTPAKLWRNYNGYSIAKQLAEAFSKTKIKPRILYRIKNSGLMYETNLSTFTGSKAIFVPYGSHEQWVLPLKNWKVKRAIDLNEPKGLSVMDLDKWVKGETQVIFNDDGTFTTL